MSPAVPTLEREATLLEQYPFIIACDEVGRGAIAGPVVVGASIVYASHLGSAIPEGLRDSKLIAEAKRHDVADRARDWVSGSGLGWASALEVDQTGIMRALGTAALRAIETVAAEAGVDPRDGVVLLDGNYDYIQPAGGWGMTVIPVIKGDRDCASAAAASVLAKVARDDYMVEVHAQAPAYQWERNKGYGSAEHRAAIVEFGITPHHRASWAFEGNTLF
ncbi:ribonuclease HII [Microbacterium mitrae]|uniref:Ribonuclease n=1 Tax=Microbacterium mitrae TaxID=664640 RepID=A0A5C8HP69_9MICO|nr:ribonuclease HII [Microbacterium mitrae]TXK05775.1 ribonuclease HII [Microbacterium mitrae]